MELIMKSASQRYGLRTEQMTEQFIIDRKRSKIAPQLVKSKLEKHGWTVSLVPDGYFPAYDLSATKGDLRFLAEVKMDYRAHETGNICLELEALSHSKASILFFCTNDKTYMLPIDDARTLASNHPVKRIVGEHGEQAALIPLQTFESLSYVKKI